MTTFKVDPGHKRVAAMTNLASTYKEVANIRGVGIGLRLLGAEYTINDLEAGQRYFVRVFAENSAKGCGEPVMTYPESEVPRKAPDAPGKSSMAVVDATSLKASWFVPNVDGDMVRSYRVERMTKSTFASRSNSYFGVQEIQILSSSSNRTYTRKRTDFTCYCWYIHPRVWRPYCALPGTVEAVTDRTYLITTADLTATIARGDRISVGDYNYTVHMFNTFNSTYLPLSTNYEGESSLGMAVYRQSHTDNIPFNATEAELEEALENMASIGQVHVTRTIEGSGYEWTITWLSDVGDQPTLVVNDLNLVGLHGPEVDVQLSTMARNQTITRRTPSKQGNECAQLCPSRTHYGN